jgi:plastocyanin
MVEIQRTLTPTLVTIFLMGLIVSGCGEKQDQAEAPEKSTEALVDDVDTAIESAMVEVSHGAFQPSELSVTIGETVDFHNVSNMPGGHTVVAGDGLFKSPPLAEDQVWQYTFDEAGTYDFHIEQHPAVTGSITVTVDNN